MTGSDMGRYGDVHTGGGVTVSIVTYNTWERTAECLASLTAQPFLQNIEILVHDNGDPCPRPEEYPATEVFISDRNLGFGAGHNRNLERAAYDTFIILNPDTSPSADTIGALDRHLRNSTVAAVAPRLVNPDGSTQQAARRMPSVWTELGRVCGLDRRYDTKFSTLMTVEESGVTYAPQPPGAALAVRTADLRRLGGFDELFKMYYEDVDLCARLSEVGRIVVDGDVTLLHDGEGTAKNYRARTTYWIERSRTVYHRKHARGIRRTVLTAACFVSQSERVGLYFLRCLVSSPGSRRANLARLQGYATALVANTGIATSSLDSKMLGNP